jgi:hypothetical protein
MFDNVSDAIKPVRKHDNKHDNRAGKGWTKPLSAILEPMEGGL